MVLLDIKSLSIKYNDSSTWAIRNNSFSIKKGELIIIAGTSGSGKTTLAQAILGIIPKFIPALVEGELTINGTNIKELSREQLFFSFGYLPQYPADFTTSLLVEEEIVFPLENLALTSDRINDRLLELLDQLEISHLQKRLITELSSGELQRVALATALAPKPPVLILDEPMARIDSKTEIKLSKILNNITKTGQSILIFEHRLDYILNYADHLILLESGKIVAQGKPKEMIDKIETVDIPEVSKINWPGLRFKPLNLEQARKLLLDKFRKINSNLD